MGLAPPKWAGCLNLFLRQLIINIMSTCAPVLSTMTGYPVTCHASFTLCTPVGDNVHVPGSSESSLSFRLIKTRPSLAPLEPSVQLSSLVQGSIAHHPTRAV